MGAVELILRQRFEVVCAEVCNRWKMMMLSVVLSIGLQLTKMMLISIRAKTRTNERHDETLTKGRIVNTSNLNR